MTKKTLIIGVLVLALAGGGYWWYTRQAAATAAAGAEVTEIAEVFRGPLIESVQSTGRVVSNQDVDIKCKASGQVINLPADISDHVKKGDLLMELDPVDQQRTVQQSQAAVVSATARVAQARANLVAAEMDFEATRVRNESNIGSALARVEDARAKAKRERELLAMKQTSVEEAETAETTLRQAEQELLSARAQVKSTEAAAAAIEARKQDILSAEAQAESENVALALAQQRVGETKVYAPIDGVVSARLVQPGMIIASGINNVGGGTAIMTVSDISRIFVLASVDESDIGRVRVDQDAKVTADSFPGMEFTGKVIRVASKGVNTSNVVTFEVKIEITSENKHLLKLEMTTNVEIIVTNKENALQVPMRAIARKEGVSRVKRQLAKDQVEEVEVTQGINNGNMVEVTGNLKEGDQIVLPPAGSDSRWRADDSNRPRTNGLLPAPPSRRGGFRP
jgi:HlyD family secretion protein